MDRRIVDHNGCWPLELTAEGVHASDDCWRINTTINYIWMEFIAPVVQETKYVDLPALAARDFNALTYWLPTVRNTGSQRESGFVEVIQVMLAEQDFTS